MSENRAKADEPDGRDQDVTDEQMPDRSEAEVVEAPVEDDLRSQLDQAQAEAREMQEQYLRARADLDNVRKRAERDVEAAHKFALEKFATELLSVRDSLEMGLQAAEQESGSFENLKEGMDLTNKMLAQAMEKFGIEVLNPEGEAFDPSFHEAVSAQASEEDEPNTVTTVMQKGYLLNGRVLRPAMVVVSKRPENG